MARLVFTLYDTTSLASSHEQFSDQDAKNPQEYINFNTYNWADKAARIIVEPGGAYVAGDHLLLLDEAKPQGGTDTVAIDPKIASDVNLNNIYNGGGFADKAAAAKFVLNPNLDGSWRLRVLLYDQVNQDYPSLIIYDWESPIDVPFDLNPLHFADKAARAIVQTGPAYQVGDHVDLLDEVNQPTDSLTLDIGDVNLNSLGWADKAAAVMFHYGA
ncbi:MAG TPA: hypothetical protein VGL94_04370 [Ktedonobacteraceae bacterium]|jgi:hypothetical protein